ncbi:MAG: lipid-A-disaccharide synthase [Alphaproteobacteria bacterium]
MSDVVSKDSERRGPKRPPADRPIDVSAVRPSRWAEAAGERDGAARRSAPHILIVAGEASGDALGRELIRGLRELTDGHVRVTGVGGEAMEGEGVRSLFPISDTSVMGLREVIPAIPRVLRRVRETADHIMEAQPDITVLIDSPDFTHRVARRIVKRAPSMKVVKYVAPQVWASRPARAARLAEMVDCVLTLFPFEAPWFEREGLPTICVGYSVVDRAAEMTGGAVFRTRHGIPADAPLLAALPGSRRNEVRLTLPLMRDSVETVQDTVRDLHVVIPVVPHVASLIEEGVADWDVPVTLVGQADKFPAFDAADAALAVSGTVTTELALARVPMVVVYKMGWLTRWLAEFYVYTPFITMINLIEQAGVVPEFIQEGATAEAIVDELLPLLTDPAARERQLADQMDALKSMGLGRESPSRRAARAVLDLIGAPPSQTKMLKGRKRFW